MTKENLKNLLRPLGAVALLIGALALVAVKNTTEDGTPVPAPGEVPAIQEAQLLLTLPPLAEFTASLLVECGDGKYSPALLAIRTEQLGRAANKYLKGLAQYLFIALPCLETRMGTHRTQLSTAGARGFIQLMPATAKAEAIRCGLGEVKSEDLMDPELNINLSACHFADLVEKHGVGLASFAYNGGGGSEALRLAKKLVPGGAKETLGYASIVSLILLKAISEKTPSRVSGGKK